MCHNVSTQAPPPKWNIPKHAQHQMSSRRDDAIFDDATTSITTRCLAVMTKSLSKVLGRFPTIKSITGR
jgi:hypothetical protein